MSFDKETWSISHFVFSVVTDLASAVVLILLGYMSLIVLVLRNRRELFVFFGVSVARRDVEIYLSRLEIKAGGTEGVEPEAIRVGYTGPALNEIEYLSAMCIRDLFRFRSISRFYSFVEKLRRDQLFALSEIDPRIGVAPKRGREDIQRKGKVLILIGSSIYNLLTYRETETRRESLFSFTRDTQGRRGIEFRQTPYTETYQSIPYEDGEDIGFVERLYDADNDTVVFICAGIGTCATAYAALYLADNWLELHRGVDKKLKTHFAVYFRIEASNRNAAPQAIRATEIQSLKVEFRPPSKLRREESLKIFRQSTTSNSTG